MKKIYTRLMIAVMALVITCTPALAINVSNVTNGGTPDAKTVQEAVAAFKALSKKEKKERFREVKKTIREYKAKKKAGEPSTNTVLLAILAVLLPPLAVYLHEGEINGKFWLSLLLTLLFFVPGVIYALIVVLS